MSPHRFFASLLGASMLVALPARAEPAIYDQASPAPEPSPHGLELGARAAAGSGTGVMYLLTGADLTYRVVPAFGFGGYADVGSVADRYQPCGALGCPRTFERVGGRLELHLAPRAALDPWVAGEVGALWVAPESGARPKAVVDASISIGGDFRPSRDLGIGLFFTAAAPPRSDTSYGGYAALGLRVTLGASAFESAAPPSVARR